MTVAEKILAVQTLYNELSTTKYNGYVAVNSSAGQGSTTLSVSPSAATKPTAPFAVSVTFIFNGLVADAIRPAQHPLFELHAIGQGTPNLGYDFTTQKFFAASLLGGFTSDPTNIVQETAGKIEIGKVHTIVFKTSPVAPQINEIVFDGAKMISASTTPSANVGYELIFKGVDVTVLSCKAYYQSGVLICSQKGENALASPYWLEQSAAFQPSTDVISVTTGDPASETLIALYLDMAAQKMLARIYPFEKDKTALDIPPIYDMTQVELAARLYARAGAEGESAHSENGISRTYKTVDDEDILSRLSPYCKAW